MVEGPARGEAVAVEVLRFDDAEVSFRLPPANPFTVPQIPQVIVDPMVRKVRPSPVIDALTAGDWQVRSIDGRRVDAVLGLVGYLFSDDGSRQEQLLLVDTCGGAAVFPVVVRDRTLEATAPNDRCSPASPVRAVLSARPIVTVAKDGTATLRSSAGVLVMRRAPATSVLTGRWRLETVRSQGATSAPPVPEYLTLDGRDGRSDMPTSATR